MRTFLFGFTPEQVQAIDAVLTKLSFAPAALIRPEHGGATVQAILDGQPSAATALKSRECLVLFHEFQDQDINRFLNGYPVPPLPQPIFAAVTEVNRRWTFAELLAALSRERRALAESRQEPGDPDD